MERIDKQFKLSLFMLLVGIILLGIGCTPDSSGDPVVVTREESPSESIDTGYCAGGAYVLNTRDVGCYLENANVDQVWWINEETAVLFPTVEEINFWIGAAVMYHPATNSMLVFDKFGDVVPEWSEIRSRAGLAFLEALIWDTELMAGVKEHILDRWQTSPVGNPEIRIGTVWQDGRNTTFLVGIAGLPSDDARFYCPSQEWIIGDIGVAVIPDCVVREPGTPVSQLFFQTHEIEGADIKLVQLTLNSVASNIIKVREGVVSVETAVYQAVLNQWGRRSLVIKGETLGGINEDVVPPDAGIDSELWQSYLSVNESPVSLRFLFQNSDAYFIQPGEVIERDYLPPGTLRAGCTYFRDEFPGLNGIVSLSQIGLSDDGSKALVHSTLECGTADIEAVYHILEKTREGWQVVETFPVSVELSTRSPELNFDGETGGCGDIFLYAANNGRSEYLVVYIQAPEYDITAGPLRLDLAENPAAVDVFIDVYPGMIDNQGYFPYCNDIAPMAQPQSTWQAVSGFLTLTTTANKPITEYCTQSYEASALLEDVTFQLGYEKVTLPSLSIENVGVGWCSG